MARRISGALQTVLRPPGIAPRRFVSPGSSLAPTALAAPLTEIWQRAEWWSRVAASLQDDPFRSAKPTEFQDPLYRKPYVVRIELLNVVKPHS